MRNGYIPQSWLKPLPGRNAGWIKGYSFAYWALHLKSIKNGGPSMAIFDGDVGRTYRSYARQVRAKQVYGSNAATPGYSNHGWGRAVDLQSQAQRSAVDRWGAPYGLQKRWSDASWEWWHIRAVKKMGKPRAARKNSIPRLLKGPEHRLVEKLTHHRKQRAIQAKSGKGPKWKYHEGWCHYWRNRIDNHRKRLHASAKKTKSWKPENRGKRFYVLGLALKGKYDFR